MNRIYSYYLNLQLCKYRIAVCSIVKIIILITTLSLTYSSFNTTIFISIYTIYDKHYLQVCKLEYSNKNY